MLRLDPPEKLNFAEPHKWLDWKQHFEWLRCATKLNKEDEVLQINALISTMGKDAEHVFKAFDEKKYAKVIEKFEILPWRRVEERWSVVLHVSKKPIKFKIDTGADISVMSVSTYEALPQGPKLKPLDTVLSSPGGMLKCKTQFTGEISLKNKPYFIDMYVIEGVCKLMELIDNAKL